MKAIAIKLLKTQNCTVSNVKSHHGCECVKGAINCVLHFAHQNPQKVRNCHSAECNQDFRNVFVSLFTSFFLFLLPSKQKN